MLLFSLSSRSPIVCTLKNKQTKTTTTATKTTSYTDVLQGTTENALCHPEADAGNGSTR